MSQNLPKTYRFHETHGNDIMITQDWSQARRMQSNDNGLVFISQPIKPHQKISIKMVQVSDKMPGILSVGFTCHDPSTLQHDLPRCTRSELKKRQGFWISSLSKNLCVKDCVLFFYVGSTGAIHYGMDGDEKGCFEKNVDTRGSLWALVDIWCPPTTIQLGPTSTKTTKFSSKNVQIREKLAQKIKKKRLLSYTFTQKPLTINEYVQVKILDAGSLNLGVTSCNPSNLNQAELPDHLDFLLDRAEYWVVINDPTWEFQKNDEISYIISEKGEMKIWKNGSLLLKVVHVDPDLKLWGFFVLSSGKNIEISTLRQGPIYKPLEPSQKIKNFENQNREEKDSECVVCYDSAVEAVFYPCGHMCMCFKCAKEQWRGGGGGNCPMCRVKIRDVLKVYKS